MQWPFYLGKRRLLAYACCAVQILRQRGPLEWLVLPLTCNNDVPGVEMWSQVTVKPGFEFSSLIKHHFLHRYTLSRSKKTELSVEGGRGGGSTNTGLSLRLSATPGR